MKTKRLLIPIIIFSQIILIAILAYSLIRKAEKTKILGEQYSLPIYSQYIDFTSTKDLKYYFEPKANISQLVKVDWLDKAVTYTFNADSLNERFDYSATTPLNTFRIITLGDSFTQGFLVNTNQNWTELLEDLLNQNQCRKGKKYEVINLGVAAYDMAYSVKRFEIRGQKYDPDLVIWFIKDDDFLMINELVLPLVTEVTNEMNLTETESVFDTQNQTAYPAWKEAANRLKTKYGKDYILDYQKQQAKHFLEIFKKHLLFVTFDFTNSNYKKLLSNYSQESSRITFYDKLINIYNDQELYLLDRHPSIKGHQIIAQDIYEYLIKNKLVPCN